MINGLSLFTGYGGIDLALREYVRPILYCDIEPYAQATLLSRMGGGDIELAPIWDDVTTLDGTKLRGLADIITAGFPCQGNSTAGKGLGLEDKRTGLFHQVIRIAKEAEPTFIFLENVAGIRTKESYVVKRELAGAGYDCRWGLVSASEACGANHERKRYFCLAAHSDRIKLRDEHWWSRWASGESADEPGNNGAKKLLARPLTNPDSKGFGREAVAATTKDYQGKWEGDGWPEASPFERGWWKTEPPIHRVDDGTPFRMDRAKACGNGVVPLQVKTAFEILMGIRR